LQGQSSEEIDRWLRNARSRVPVTLTPFELRPAVPLRLLLVLPILIASSAAAQRVNVVTGFEGGTNFGYGFVTSSLTVEATEMVDLIGFWTLSYLYYSYADHRGAVEVRSPGTTVGGALRIRVPDITLTVGPAYEVRQTTRRIGAETQTFRQAGPLLQGDLFARPAPMLTFSLAGSFSWANDYGRTRAALMRQLTAESGEIPVMISLGAEVFAQGNPEAQAVGAGGILGFNLPGRTSLHLRAGYMQYTAGDVREGRPYFGIGFFGVF
jgi:hypothetical protein